MNHTPRLDKPLRTREEAAFDLAKLALENIARETYEAHARKLANHALEQIAVLTAIRDRPGPAAA